MKIAYFKNYDKINRGFKKMRNSKTNSTYKPLGRNHYNTSFEVVKALVKCSFCGHNRVIIRSGKTKCSKCRKEV